MNEQGTPDTLILSASSDTVRTTCSQSEARFKRGTSYVPNIMQVSRIYCFHSFALDSAYAKFDV